MGKLHINGAKIHYLDLEDSKIRTGVEIISSPGCSWWRSQITRGSHNGDGLNIPYKRGQES
jgi:hypothetical protein